ncbi:Glycerol-1-phosphate dehydrogenase [NAD(P)+] [uncultured archaeon]|nr:Glycerol-1-phosphate dehydrogenase [NAD(P)+] [uncultured archaeon]
MKNIELPSRVLVGEDAIKQASEFVSSLRLEALPGTPLLVSDATAYKIAGEEVAKKLGAANFLVSEATEKEVQRLLDRLQGDGVSYLVAVGGGTVIDVAKVASFRKRMPFVSIPTAASHDGIASPRASLKGEKPMSVEAHEPIGILADLTIIAKAPKKLLAAGCADAISNYTAVRDWRIAHREKKEYYGDYAAALADMSARIIMESGPRVYDNISILVEALISSGIAIGIAGSTRPCSGSEHLFSHMLDIICEKHALHGEQVGVGAIMMAYLQRSDWEAVRSALNSVGAPTTAAELDIPPDKIIEALTSAHKVRDRYTVLRGGLSHHRAVALAKKTGVIP